jgi:hypothetical protein
MNLPLPIPSTAEASGVPGTDRFTKALFFFRIQEVGDLAVRRVRRKSASESEN